MRRLTAVAVLVVIVAACNGTEGADPTLAPGPSSSTIAPTTTVATTTSSAAPTTEPTEPTATSTTSTPPEPTPPVPDPTEGDIPTIWQQLMDYHNWAFANPDLADATQYLAESCDCLERAEAILAEYIDEGWHVGSGGLIVHSVEVEISSSTFALLTVVDEQAETTILGPGDEIVEVLERRPKTFFDVRIRLTEDGWRIAEWNQRGAEGAAE